MESPSAAVVIPVYKAHPTDSEVLSIKRCLKILRSYPIIFCAPDSLEMNAYRPLISSNEELMVVRFDDHYFNNIQSYNRLMLNSKFYYKFKRFQYILIYQPDAYVFRDELAYWCRTGYDYIGAPWFNEWNESGPDSGFLGVGNGGFSLRKVQSHLKVLRSFSYLTPARTLIQRFLDQQFSLSAIKQLLLDLTLRNNTYSQFNNYNDNEDIFWGMVAAKRFRYFKVPSMQTALRFSMEVNAELLYGQNGHELPFGCHGWEKYETGFWKRFIPVA